MLVFGYWGEMLYDKTKRLIYSFIVIWINMITKKQVLIFKASADTLYLSRDYTSSTILYFKTLFAVQDFLLLEKIGNSPKDHTERFKQLKANFQDLFKELDIEFSTYRDTYSKLIDKATCDRIKKLVENDIEKYKLAQ